MVARDYETVIYEERDVVSQESIAEGQKVFESGKRIEWRGR